MTTKGFTLIEILVAVMLTGLLAALALAPVATTVRRVVDTQAEYSDVAALSRTMNFIVRDLNSAMRLASNVITIKDHESLGGHARCDVLLQERCGVSLERPYHQHHWYGRSYDRYLDLQGYVPQPRRRTLFRYPRNGGDPV